jgi:type IV pilus assembly protein PilO
MAIGANMTKREQSLVGLGVISILAAVAFWYFVYNPKSQQIAAVTAHTDSVETLNRQARIDLKRGTAKQLQSEAVQYEENLRLMRLLVPTTNEVPALLEDVSTAARRVGLDIASVEPAPVVEGEQFDTYRYKVSAMGGYHAIAQFLSNVGSLNRIVAPVGVDLKPHTIDRTKTKVKSGESMLDATFQIQTYITRTTPLVLRSEGGPPR